MRGHNFDFQVDKAYRTLSRCNQALVRARDERELTGKICEILVETDKYSLAWVAMKSAHCDGVEIYGKAGESPGQEKDYLISWAETLTPEQGPGLTCRTVAANRLIIEQTPHPLPDWQQRPNGEGKPEQLPAISLPLRQGRDAIGALNILADSPAPFSRQEIRLLNELAGDLSFGISTIRARRRHNLDFREKLRLQSQLRQAQKLEAIGTMAGGIAHDFNNMLHVILGYSGLLMRSLPEESENHRYSSTIKEAGVSAAELIKRILTFSRMSEKELKPLHIQQMLKEALKLLRSTLPSTIELQQEINLACGPVLADPTEIHQIVMNLGTNAYHAMRQRGGVLRVSLDEVEVDRQSEESMAGFSLGLDTLQPGRHLRLEFVDHGSGMDPATIQRIFDPYFTTKEVGEGTGLGLAVIWGIIKGGHGAVTVWSAPGRGSTFKIFLPLIEQEPQAPETPQTDSGCLLSDIGCKRVLFVDDVEYNVILGEHTLRHLGCEVTGTTSSREALEIYRSFPSQFDLVITDQTMPDLTGFELAHRMLAISPRLPIILLTGHSDQVDAETARQAGIRHFLIKPIDLNNIARLIREIFQPA